MLHIDIIGMLTPVLKGTPKARDIVGTLVGALAELATGVVERFMGGTRDGETFMRAEEEIFKATTALGGQIMAATLAAVHEDAEWLRSTSAQSRARVLDAEVQRHAGMRETVVSFLGGVCARIVTPYYRIKRKVRVGRRRGVGRRGPSGAGKGCYPAFEALGIRDRVTPALASEIARQTARCASFEEAQEALAERGCSLDSKTVRRVALRVGSAALEQRRARIEAAAGGKVFTDELANQRVVIGTDGGRLRTREGGKRGRRNKKTGRRRFRGTWREPKLVNAYVVDANGKQARKAVPLYDGTLGDADAAFAILVAELKLRGASKAEQIVLTGDGAVWIWNRADELADALGLPRNAIVKVVDFYHAVEHLTAIAEERAWSAAQRKAWVRRQRRQLYDGHIDRVLDAIRALCRGRNAKKIGVHLSYFENRRDYLRYDLFRAMGLPCGSGATESAIRRVVNLRLKGPGIFWEPKNAERMLHLRAYLKAGRWDELMRRVVHGTPNGRPAVLAVSVAVAA